MKLQLRLILLATIVACIGTTLAVRAQEPLSIRVRPSHDGISPGGGVEKSGSHIYVLVSLTNNSDRNLSTSNVDYSEYYEFDIRDAEGNLAPETEFMQKMRTPGHRKITSGLVGQYKPGENWEEQIRISDYYDMSRPSVYTIQLERKLPVELGMGTVKSNTITITIVAPKPNADNPK